MSWTLIFIIVVTSIVVLFSDEFNKLIKGLLKRPWRKLVIPLLAASALVEHYHEGVFWVVVRLQYGVNQLVSLFHIGNLLSAEAVSVASIGLLFLLGCLPIWIAYGVAKYKHWFEPWPHARLVGSVLWLVAVVLLLIP